jgi:hypothetical protein
MAGGQAEEGVSPALLLSLVTGGEEELTHEFQRIRPHFFLFWEGSPVAKDFMQHVYSGKSH